MDTNQYAELYLAESREHVSAMNHSLLELERGGNTAEAVSAIFRAVHTVKGMSATMGYSAVAELAHELETVLDRVRRNELPVSGDLMDLLFRGADALEQGVESSVTGSAVSFGTLLAALRGEVAGGSAESGAPTTASPAQPTVGAGWTVPAPTGPGLLVRVRLQKDAPLRGVRAFLVVQAARRVGDVIATSPPLDDLQAERFDADFALRVRTESPAAEVARVIRGAGDVADVEVTDGAPRRSTMLRASGAVQAADIAAAEAALDGATSGAATGPADTHAGGPAGNGRDGARGQRHVRIDLRRLDSLMNLIGELVITRGRLQQLAAATDDAALDETVTQASRLIGDLRDEIMTSRMVPVWQVFDRFPRVVRDGSRALGKQIEFTIEGKEIELDRSMLEEIGDSIVHLLRNAVDHGIETPEERLAAGKAPTGRLLLSAVRDRSAVVIRVSDDGRGIDRTKVLARARASGLVDAAKTELNDDELLRLVSRPGFSTAERVTELSGRGVGVDAVYTRVRSLGGAVDIRTTEGQGTTVTLRLPLTLAIVRALLARVEDESYAIPLTHVSETVELTDALHRTLRGREVLVMREDVLPLLRLRTLVGLPPLVREAGAAPEHVIIIDVADRRAGLVVDELTGQQEIVVKQFDAVRNGLPIFGGATILGDGSPALIVDVSSLL